MATDKRLDQVSQLTDFDYALIVKGDQVAKASKQQLAELVGNLLYGATNASSLATVVAEQMGAMKLTTIPSHGVFNSIEQVDALKTFGQAYVYSNVIQTYTEGYLYCLPNINKGGAVQFFFSYNGSAAIKRVYNWSLKAWSGWSTL